MANWLSSGPNFYKSNIFEIFISCINKIDHYECSNRFSCINDYGNETLSTDPLALTIKPFILSWYCEWSFPLER